ncbi:MAG: outer membrane protein assembly factor BamD, partial [Pyrinomonadaceae bacterium]
MVALLCAILILSSTGAVWAQGQAGGSPAQRIEVMRQRLEAMRRSLNSAIAAMNARDNGENGKPAPDDPRERLRGLEKEANSILGEVSDVRGKQDRSERYDAAILDRLETSITDLNTRVEQGLRDTAAQRNVRVTPTTTASATKKKKKGHLFGLLGGGGGDEKYAELTGTVAAGRDRVLFEDAVKEVRKGNQDTGRLLFNTIITTYPDSPYLRLSKLAIADSFYLEGDTSALIQAAAAYQDWLTFFPTDPLADDAMLKVAEAEMRQMGLSDRDVSHARKAEVRLKVLLQQFPQTQLRQLVQTRLDEVQENLAMHNLQVAQFYYDARYKNHKGGLKGAQSRLREVVEKYPHFSYMAEVLYRLGATYIEEEEPDEAAKFFQKIVRDFPNSQYAEKAKDQLTAIGAQIPTPDPERMKVLEPVRPSIFGGLMQQIAGNANVDVSKDGILISHDSKANSDLIDKAIVNQGEIPSNETPNAPVNRTLPARPVAPTVSASPPDDKKSGATEKKIGGAEIKIAPSQQGSPVPDRVNPAMPKLPPAANPTPNPTKEVPKTTDTLPSNT